MKRAILVLTILFFAVFSGLAITGAYIVYSEASYAQSQNGNNSSSNTGVKVKVEKNSASFEITNALPGLVVLFVGVIGLITMLIKIPIREALINEFIMNQYSTSNDRLHYIDGIQIDKYRSVNNKNNIMTHNKAMSAVFPKNRSYELGFKKAPLPVWLVLRIFHKLK